ncbi:bifunctional hydroxymethylpyrimidine kinase/phosphomethylpyrimidine kinase [Edaphobacter aggregans]|uniref:bifunctional hydroxymethylpyrimidine kinase/phosphomethylpyrimidine kinase n=1 Tax=Edaphobacter aggregans TaxID=570835 RepID=UPI00055791B1|nr:bifunctional hydroxymethylpyrimidine kinase/phosphomethylpyrimidine kinase [Edaphobacter aggregans]
MQTVLTIAGFDPSSGAGVTADLMVFAAHGLFGTSVITSLTVQSTTGVRSSQPVEAGILRQTLDCLHADLPPAGVKLGMLASAAIVEVVADYLEELKRDSPRLPVVLDPVIRSSSGRELLSPDGLALLRERLLPLASWTTPNLAELSALTGLPVNRHDDLEPATRALQHYCPALNVLATGGHLDSPDDLLLTSEGDFHWLAGERIESTSTHGTGCALSSALLSRLVLGGSALEAAWSAKHYVAEAIRRASPLGHGHGPLNHLWPLHRQD